jgi:hypothetical protein
MLNGNRSRSDKAAAVAQNKTSTNLRRFFISGFPPTWSGEFARMPSITYLASMCGETSASHYHCRLSVDRICGSYLPLPRTANVLMNTNFRR